MDKSVKMNAMVANLFIIQNAWLLVEQGKVMIIIITIVIYVFLDVQEIIHIIKKMKMKKYAIILVVKLNHLENLNI